VWHCKSRCARGQRMRSQEAITYRTSSGAIGPAATYRVDRPASLSDVTSPPQIGLPDQYNAGRLQHPVHLPQRQGTRVDRDARQRLTLHGSTRPSAMTCKSVIAGDESGRTSGSRSTRISRSPCGTPAAVFRGHRHRSRHAARRQILGCRRERPGQALAVDRGAWFAPLRCSACCQIQALTRDGRGFHQGAEIDAAG